MENRVAKFRTGEKVKVVNYGAPIWSTKPLDSLKFIGEKGGMQYYDMHPEWVGREAVIDGISQSQYEYSLQFIDNGAHIAWFSEQQLENAAP